MSTSIQSQYEFKAWSNQQLFAHLQDRRDELGEALLHKAIRILNHIYVVDAIFKGHLEGKPHGYVTTNTDPFPSLDELQLDAAQTDAWYIAYSKTLTEPALTKLLRFDFTDGDKGCMSIAEIMAHVAAHGGYHRGQVGQMLKEANAAPPSELYTRFLHSREPQRRSA